MVELKCCREAVKKPSLCPQGAGTGSKTDLHLDTDNPTTGDPKKPEEWRPMARENHCILQKARGKVKSWKKFLREGDVLPMGFGEEVGFCWLKGRRGVQDRGTEAREWARDSDVSLSKVRRIFIPWSKPCYKYQSTCPAFTIQQGCYRWSGGVDRGHLA